MSLFIIVTGNYTISNPRAQTSKNTLLVKGDHFGEIGLLYDCQRTCSVQSIDYTILARLTKPRLRMLLSDFPLLKEELLKHVYSYKDDFKDMMLTLCRKIPFLNNLTIAQFHQIIYSFKRVGFEQNEIVLRQFDVIDSLIIVESGNLEVIMHVDGLEMVVARLAKGDCLNYKNILLGSRKMFLTVKCSSRSTLLLLRREAFDAFLNDHRGVKWVVMRHILSYDRDGSEFLLDKLPRSRSSARKIVLQNTVMQIIIKLRIQREKPSLAQLFKKFKELGFPKDLINDLAFKACRKSSDQIQDE